MWALYLLALGLSLAGGKTVLLAVALLCSAASFGLGVWLLFQPNRAAIVNGAVKLAWDFGMALFVFGMLTRSGELATLMTRLGF